MQVDLDGENWVLTEIGDVEWFMLVQLPEAADASQSERGYRRLFPDLTDESEKPEIRDDWKQFVQPEIEDQFAREIQTVTHDLGTVEEIEGEQGAAVHQLRLPISHASTWYSVLNQARLILNEEHQIAELEQQLLFGNRNPTDIDERKWLIMVQYRVYAAIQEFLLSELLDN